jgi:hypothetical protein
MIGKLTAQLINRLVEELNKIENRIKLEKEILNPILSTFTNKLYPYVSLLFIMYSINLFFLILILILILMKK